MPDLPDIATINSAITTALGAATGISKTWDYDELREGITDFPLIAVYWDMTEPVSRGSNTSVITFGGNHYLRHRFFADLIQSRLSRIADDMARLIPLIDNVNDVLRAQINLPLFGVDRTHIMQWSWERMVFEWGNYRYLGARCYIHTGVW